MGHKKMEIMGIHEGTIDVHLCLVLPRCLHSFPWKDFTLPQVAAARLHKSSATTQAQAKLAS